MAIIMAPTPAHNQRRCEEAAGVADDFMMQQKENGEMPHTRNGCGAFEIHRIKSGCAKISGTPVGFDD
jgi:hypothetical protein